MPSNLDAPGCRNPREKTTILGCDIFLGFFFLTEIFSFDVLRAKLKTSGSSPGDAPLFTRLPEMVSTIKNPFPKVLPFPLDRLQGEPYTSLFSV